MVTSFGGDKRQNLIPMTSKFKKTKPTVLDRDAIAR